MKPISKETNNSVIDYSNTKKGNLLLTPKQLSKAEELKNKINVIFQPLISDIVIKQPLDEKEIYKYLINYLIKMKGEKVNDTAIKEYSSLKKKKLDDLDEDFFVDINEQNNTIDLQTLRKKIAKKKPKVDYSDIAFGLYSKEPYYYYDFNILFTESIMKNQKLIIAKLKEFFYFKSFTDEEITNFAQNFNSIPLNKNEKLFKKIPNQNIILIVLKGNLNVYKNDKLIQVLSAEELYGDLFIPYPRPYKIEITAAVPSEILYLPHDTVMAINKAKSKSKFDDFKRLLHSSAYFRNECSENDLVQLYLVAERIFKKKHELVIRKGEDYDGIFIIEKGIVQAVLEKNITTTINNSGIIGVPGLKNGQSLADYRVISNECKLLKISKQHMDGFREKGKVYFQFD